MVDIVTQINSPTSDNGPLSLQILEKLSNKCLDKYFNLQCVISAVGINLNIMDKYHEFFYR
jgi:hypothetical protein